MAVLSWPEARLVAAHDAGHLVGALDVLQGQRPEAAPRVAEGAAVRPRPADHAALLAARPV